MADQNGRCSPDVLSALERYADTVRRVCSLYLRRREDIEDVFQDVFLKYLQRTEPFEQAEHEKAWIIRVTINRCKDFAGSFWQRRILPLDPERLSVQPAERHGLLEAVMKLPEKERTVIFLFYYEGYAATEIAGITGQNVNTVYSHLHRARARLRRYLGGNDDEKSNPAGL